MNGSIELSPTQLAQIVVDVCAANGLAADGLALFSGGQLVGFDRAVIVLKDIAPLKVPQPKEEANAYLKRLLEGKALSDN